MKTDLNRDQIMMIVERARRQHAIEAGEVIATGTRSAIAWLSSRGDKLLHSLQFMLPTARYY